MSLEEPEILGDITEIEIIAVKVSIRDLAQLRRNFGGNAGANSRVLPTSFGMEELYLLKYIGMSVTALAVAV